MRCRDRRAHPARPEAHGRVVGHRRRGQRQGGEADGGAGRARTDDRRIVRRPKATGQRPFSRFSRSVGGHWLIPEQAIFKLVCHPGATPVRASWGLPRSLRVAARRVTRGVATNGPRTVGQRPIGSSREVISCLRSSGSWRESTACGASQGMRRPPRIPLQHNGSAVDGCPGGSGCFGPCWYLLGSSRNRRCRAMPEFSGLALSSGQPGASDGGGAHDEHEYEEDSAEVDLDLPWPEADHQLHSGPAEDHS